MSSIKDQLKEKAKGKLAVSETAVVPVVTAVQSDGAAELSRITREIRSDLDELEEISEWWKNRKARIAEIQRNVLEKLIFVRDNKKRLLSNRTFEDYLTSDVGLSKGHFYEQIQAYNVCVEYKKPELFDEVDTKILVNIAREEDKAKQRKLMERAPSLTRDFFKKSDTSDSGSTAKKKKTFVAKVNRQKMTIKVADLRILKQIETLLAANGIDLEYE